MKKRLPKGKKIAEKRKRKGPASRALPMTDDELAAAVEEHENSDEGRAARKRKPESRAARLTKLFYETAEGRELRQTADTINSRLNMGDTVAVKIHVPKEFIRLTEFLEQKKVAGTAIAPRPTAKVLNQILLNELHDQLHWLTVGPARYEYYRNLWNRFCDQHGAPEEKIADPASGPAQDGEKGPF
jgi:hypothetical protein